MMENDRLKAVFVMNPISGASHFISRRSLIERYVNPSRLDFEIRTTGYAGHAVEIARESAGAGADIVVAVGGDGTVNEVARGLIGTGTALGIVPCGSGNGLARHLCISMKPVASVKWLNDIRILDMDYGLINGHPFFTTCGVGFDAAVSQKFSESHTRGAVKYIEKILHELRQYHNDTYSLAIDGEAVDMEAFLITCANANQWGNGAFIAPSASVCDGLLDISAIPRFSAIDVPVLAYQLMNKQLEHNSRFFGRKCRELVIRRSGECVAHYDGDPVRLTGDICISAVPKGIRVAVPNDAKDL